MNKQRELSGKKFNRWYVIERGGKDNFGAWKWLCQCDCGVRKEIVGYGLVSGRSKSCGCYSAEIKSKQAKKLIAIETHGMSETRLYRIHRGMRDRCNLKSHSSYRLYGGRGISYCKEWEDFNTFMNWSLNNGYQENLVIDRIDSNGNYEPLNCRWVTPKENANNMRTNRHITICGITKTLQQWADYSGVSNMTIHARLRYGWSGEKLLKPARDWGRK